MCIDLSYNHFDQKPETPFIRCASYNAINFAAKYSIYFIKLYKNWSKDNTPEKYEHYGVRTSDQKKVRRNHGQLALNKELPAHLAEMAPDCESVKVSSTSATQYSPLQNESLFKLL